MCNRRISFVDVDIYSSRLPQIQEIGDNHYSSIVRVGDFIIAQDTSGSDKNNKSIRVWDFKSDFNDESLIVYKELPEEEKEEKEKEKEEKEEEENKDLEHQLHAGVTNVVLSFNGKSYYSFKLQKPDGQTEVI